MWKDYKSKMFDPGIDRSISTVQGKPKTSYKLHSIHSAANSRPMHARVVPEKFRGGVR